MTIDKRQLVVAAGTANVVVHVVGLAFALFALRGGSPVVALDQRVGYLSGHPPGWALGWSVWILCALALVAFLASLRPFGEPDALVSASIRIGLTGAAVDLICDLGQILILPDRAAALLTVSGLDEFLLWERRVNAGGLVVANGLYSIAVLAATLAVRRLVPWHGILLGLATFAAGMWLAWVGFTGDPRPIEPATALTFLAFLSWTMVLTRALGRDADASAKRTVHKERGGLARRAKDA